MLRLARAPLRLRVAPLPLLKLAPQPAEGARQPHAPRERLALLIARAAAPPPLVRMELPPLKCLGVAPAHQAR